MRITIDMETRSEVDLRLTGVYPYADSDTTDILCIAVKVDDQNTRLWVNPRFYHLTGVLSPLSLESGAWMGMELISSNLLADLMSCASEIHAHNAQFERVMWDRIMHHRYGLPNPALEVWRCTMAKASTYTLPRDLARACKVLNLPVQKDAVGHKVMMKMCKPLPRERGWHEATDDFATLCRYCVQDVEAEYCLDQALPDPIKEELEVYHLDQRINDNGIYVALEDVQNLIHKVEYKERRLLHDIQSLTEGAIKSTRQRDATLAWLAEQGVKLDDLRKETVADALLTPDMSPEARRLLKIRTSLAKTSVAKLKAMQRYACSDSRVRGSILYHGANTGRFAGRGIQPHNYPRESYDEPTLDALLYGSLAHAEKDDKCILHEASKCLRGMLTAAPGYILLGGDFASIEARGLAWLAGEEPVLEAFRQGLDAYKVAVLDHYGVSYDEVTSAQRRVGKVIVLACGYQGWVGAFRQIGSDEVNTMSDEEIAEVVGSWRNSRPLTVALWRGLEEAAKQTVLTGKPHSYGRIKYGMRGDFLHCRLPSGRLLAYYKPSLAMKKTPYGTMREVIQYWGINSYTNQWALLTTYGGKLTENAVQALCRDILTEAMLRIDKEFLPDSIVLHVHDEIVSEIAEELMASDTQENFDRIITQVPEWATGFPIDAESWIGRRYRKG